MVSSQGGDGSSHSNSSYGGSNSSSDSESSQGSKASLQRDASTSSLSKLVTPEILSDVKSHLKQLKNTENIEKRTDAAVILQSPALQWEMRQKKKKNETLNRDQMALIQARLKVKQCLLDLPKDESVETFYFKCVASGMEREVKVLFTMLKVYKNVSFDKNFIDEDEKSAMILAIDNRDKSMMELLLENGVEPKESIFHCIKSNYLEGAKLLLEKNDCIEIEIKGENNFFKTCLTPMILAGQNNNYEMLYLLHKFGHEIQAPEDELDSNNEAWETTNKRRMICQARASPAYITLMNSECNMNPVSYCLKEIQTVRQYKYIEHDSDFYEDIQNQLEDYMCALLDQICSSEELANLFQYDYEPVKRSSLKTFFDDSSARWDLENCFELLELASEQRLMRFVAHHQSQLAVSYVRYRSLPFLRRRNWFTKTLLFMLIGLLFPLLSIFYLIDPKSKLGGIIQLPTVLYISHLMSDVFFSILLLINVLGQSINNDTLGSMPTVVQWLILVWILGKWVQEVEECYKRGCRAYFGEIWNFVDIVILVLFSFSAFVRFLDMILNRHTNPTPRSQWNSYEPRLIAEGFQAWAYVFIFLRLLGLMRVSRHLGPLQVSLGRMVTDVIRFLCIFVLLLAAFTIGLSELYWYYDTQEGSLISCNATLSANDSTGTCARTQRKTVVGTMLYLFSSLFWALFGEMNFATLNLAGKHQFTQAVGWSLVAIYHFVAIIVMLNMLIAMMNNSYTETSEKEETVWKFQRTLIWIRFFRREVVRPPPMNLIPNIRKLYAFIKGFMNRTIELHADFDQDFNSKKSRVRFWNEVDYLAPDQSPVSGDVSTIDTNKTQVFSFDDTKSDIIHCNPAYDGSTSSLDKQIESNSVRISMSPKQYLQEQFAQAVNSRFGKRAARSKRVLDILVRRYKLKYLTERKHAPK